MHTRRRLCIRHQESILILGCWNSFTTKWSAICPWICWSMCVCEIYEQMTLCQNYDMRSWEFLNFTTNWHWSQRGATKRCIINQRPGCDETFCGSLTPYTGKTVSFNTMTAPPPVSAAPLVFCLMAFLGAHLPMHSCCCCQKYGSHHSHSRIVSKQLRSLKPEDFNHITETRICIKCVITYAMFTFRLIKGWARTLNWFLF